MRALVVIVPVLGALVIVYRFYSAFIAAKVMALNDARVTPAHQKYDGANYYPTTRWVLFGHHFAAIAGAGPLVGPVLATQFGFAPGLMWLVAGVCLAGAVQDSIWLWASTRRGGRSLADIARTEVGTLAGLTAAVAVLFVLIVTMAGLGIIVVNALADSAWATFTIFVTIPLAVVMGFYMFRWRQGHIKEATIIGVAVLILSVIFGKNVAESSYRPLVRADASPGRHRHGALHDRRVGAPGLDAADAARLSQHVPEAGHDRVSRDRRDDHQPEARGAGVLANSWAAAGRSFPGRCFPSSSSPLPAARSPASMS